MEHFARERIRHAEARGRAASRNVLHGRPRAGGAFPRFPMLAGLLVVLLAELLGLPGIEALAEPGAGRFRGWETMRVILQEGRPGHMRRLSVTGEGPDELVMVNARHARLDLYRWRGAGAAHEAGPEQAPSEQAPPEQAPSEQAPPEQAPPEEEALDPDRPNELPMAPELVHEKYSLDRLPADVLAGDVTGDGRSDLLVLVTGPPAVILLEARRPGERDGKDPRWEETARWDLLEGAPAGQGRLMRLRRPGDGEGPPELLVSFEKGLQVLSLEAGARPHWLEPRVGGRQAWWLLDLDGDGARDLVSFDPERPVNVRWRRAADGRLLPPEGLHEQQAAMAVAIPGGQAGPAELLLLGARETGLVRRYRFGHEAASPLGHRAALPLPGDRGAPWAGVEIAGTPALVAADPGRPRLVVHRWENGAWGPQESFPAVSDIEALVASPARPGMLLIAVAEAGTLYTSRWEGGRFTYPRPESFGPAEAAGGEASPRQILALDRVGRTLWWAVRVGAALDLYVWPPGAGAPRRTRFEGAGEKTRQVRWLGGERLVALDQYARHPRLIERVEGQTLLRQPAHVRRSAFESYRLFEVAGAWRPARVSDGVLRWLDADLHARDQVMLGGGQALSGFVPIAGEEGLAGAWALERGGRFVQRLEPDEAGILRMVAREKLSGGRSLAEDPALGLILENDRGLVRLAPGRTPRLELAGSLDGEAARPEGIGEATIHRLFTADVRGEGRKDLLLADDEHHRLTLLVRRGEGFEPRLSWTVFEDRKYPYGGGFGQGGRAGEPRALLGLDLDGDGHQDLAMLSHDRLVIYLGRAPEPE